MLQLIISASVLAPIAPYGIRMMREYDDVEAIVRGEAQRKNLFPHPHLHHQLGA